MACPLRFNRLILMKKILLPLLLLPLAFAACKNDKPASTVTTAEVSTEKVDSAAEQQVSPTIKTLDPSLKGNDILSAIATDHKGKVVVIDVWATWCGPCTRAIEEMHPLKKELLTKDVAFVYLTDESSPEMEWNKRIQLYQGTHYRIPEAQMATFDLVGYPSYIVLDKNGKVAFDNRPTAGFPGNDVLRNIVTPLLK